MKTLTNDYTHINGWGIDADPENEPTYPIKNYTGDDHNRINWIRPTLQRTDVEVLHSNERPSLSAVYGTTTPPKGISGAIRRYAFKFSESSYGHWLPLLLADRVDMIEGVVDDLKHGHIPNIFAERGWKAELKYNPKGFVVKVATGIVIGVILYNRFLKKGKR
jgi:hypothetical protein